MYTHSIGTRVIASILFASHSLMSCSGLIGIDQQIFKKEVVPFPQQEVDTSNHLGLEEENELALSFPYEATDQLVLQL
jgi:hypothetical protein